MFAFIILYSLFLPDRARRQSVSYLDRLIIERDRIIQFAFVVLICVLAILLLNFSFKIVFLILLAFHSLLVFVIEVRINYTNDWTSFFSAMYQKDSCYDAFNCGTTTTVFQCHYLILKYIFSRYCILDSTYLRRQNDITLPRTCIYKKMEARESDRNLTIMLIKCIKRTAQCTFSVRPKKK